MKKPRLNCTIIAMCCIVQMSELYNVIWPSYFLQINLYLLLGNVDTVAPVRLRLFAVFLCCHWWWIFFFQPWDLSIHRIWRPTTKQTLKYQWPLFVTLKTSLTFISFFSSSYFFSPNITSPCSVKQQTLSPSPLFLCHQVHFSFSVFFLFFPSQQRWKKSLVKENEKETATKTE